MSFRQVRAEYLQRYLGGARAQYEPDGYWDIKEKDVLCEHATEIYTPFSFFLGHESSNGFSHVVHFPRTPRGPKPAEQEKTDHRWCENAR